MLEQTTCFTIVIRIKHTLIIFAFLLIFASYRAIRSTAVTERKASSTKVVIMVVRVVMVASMGPVAVMVITLTMEASQVTRAAKVASINPTCNCPHQQVSAQRQSRLCQS